MIIWYVKYIYMYNLTRLADTIKNTRTRTYTHFVASLFPLYNEATTKTHIKQNMKQHIIPREIHSHNKGQRFLIAVPPVKFHVFPQQLWLLIVQGLQLHSDFLWQPASEWWFMFRRPLQNTAITCGTKMFGINKWLVGGFNPSEKY